MHRHFRLFYNTPRSLPIGGDILPVVSTSADVSPQMCVYPLAQQKYVFLTFEWRNKVSYVNAGMENKAQIFSLFYEIFAFSCMQSGKEKKKKKKVEAKIARPGMG